MKDAYLYRATIYVLEGFMLAFLSACIYYSGNIFELNSTCAACLTALAFYNYVKSIGLVLLYFHNKHLKK